VELVGHLGSAPSVFPLRAGRIAIFLVHANRGKHLNVQRPTLNVQRPTNGSGRGVQR